MTTLKLEQQEIQKIDALLDEVAAQYHDVEGECFLEAAGLFAHELPWRVRETMVNFKLHEPSEAICTISGYPIDDRQISKTPPHWKDNAERQRTFKQEIYLVLLGSLLGECIGWSTQQDGRIVHDILPVEGNESEQLGSGSETTLWWHVEDAFHPYRGDYLGLFCLRNPDRVSTTFASLEGVELAPEHWRLLFESRYTIRPDESHLKKNDSGLRQIDGDLETSYAKMQERNKAPSKIPVLLGDRQRPYVRIDPYFMDPVDDPKYQDALDALIAALDGRLEDQILEPGDVCFIDNYQGVHGRRAFKARYDGTDRWLKRVNIVRNLRKSRSARKNASSRIIF